MILLAALLCNYGRGKCLIIIGTEGYASAMQSSNPPRIVREKIEGLYFHTACAGMNPLHF
jgi:hypothetical protein